ncbi:MAG: BamA/TamA family outer membrane protein [Candidatus Symbiothrix sp.]|jgi:outer membrane protein assembly factor BamA|nr:BamA/TamA family outer membrane protein [Candidatus Symbiothrix sp.]
MKQYSLILLALLFAACSVTKHIPEGSYLLGKADIQMIDDGADKTLLNNYIHQKPNTSKNAVRIYGLVKNDSSWLKRFIRKLGEAPVIFNNHAVALSVQELMTEMHNQGYLNASVSAEIDTINKKAQVIYHIRNEEPYRIRKYTIDIPQMQRHNPVDSSRVLADRRLIREGSIFNLEQLESERKRIATSLRNRGYYTFNENNLRFLADTALRSKQVDLQLVLADTNRINPVYRVQRIKVFSGFDPLDKKAYQIEDSLEYNGIQIYYDSLRFLRPSVIRKKIRVRPQQVFRERAGESTYKLLQNLDCMGRTDLQYAENNYPDSTLLDCNIYLTPGDNHSMQITWDGTHKAGDLGLAVGITYGNLNLFNGSELFNIRLRGAYEWVAGTAGNDTLTHNYYELGVSPSLTFPSLHLPWLGEYLSENYHTQTQYSMDFNLQKRPEYIRNFFNFRWQFNWTAQRKSLSQSLALLDINYVNMPWKSDLFQNYLDWNVDALTKFSYANTFTAGITYNLLYNNAQSGRIQANSYTIRLHLETSGNALYGLAKAFGVSHSEEEQYRVLGNPFAQYIKGDFDWTESVRLSSIETMAFHINLGIAVPYLNSNILPFEKRYFAGGPNSVRGWHTRYLGPGSFRWENYNPTLHVGDINLLLNAEYRIKVLSWLEPAVFVDAGNIWTIKNYDNQPGGQFRWNRFYKELATGAGIGLRLDLGFLILRFDYGTQVINPMAENQTFVLFKGDFWKQSTGYLAIGYPF